MLQIIHFATKEQLRVHYGTHGLVRLCPTQMAYSVKNYVTILTRAAD